MFVPNKKFSHVTCTTMNHVYITISKSHYNISGDMTTLCNLCLLLKFQTTLWPYTARSKDGKLSLTSACSKA